MVQTGGRYACYSDNNDSEYVRRRTYNLTVEYEVDGVKYKRSFDDVYGRWHYGQEITVYYMDEPDGDSFCDSEYWKYIWVLTGAVTAFFIYKVRGGDVPSFLSDLFEG